MENPTYSIVEVNFVQQPKLPFFGKEKVKTVTLKTNAE